MYCRGLATHVELTVPCTHATGEMPFLATMRDASDNCVELIKNARLLQSFTPDTDICHQELEDETGGPAFYHCRVTQSDGHLAVCSPVWLG